MSVLFWIAVGCVIGWHVPMPPWAEFAINWVKAKFIEIAKKDNTPQ